MQDAPKASDHKWNADRPGDHPDHDELGRKPFAQRIAKELRAWRQKESLVVSLNGDWGSGKTTLSNLILYYIDEQSKRAGELKSIIVKFNPWQWSGQNLLLEAFFSEVGAAFRADKIGDAFRSARLARFWDGVKVVTVATGELATKVQEGLTASAALLAGGSGVLSSYIENPFWKAFLNGAGLVLLAIAALCAIYAPVAEKLAAWFEWGGKKTKPTVEEARAHLRQELQMLKAPVIVVIDDIDRLTKREVCLIVQLVKANADFPNVVYLMLYQKSIVAKSLDDITSEKGHDFLKKVVQVDLEVPAAPDHKLRQIFGERLECVLRRAEVRWDKERWRGLFEDAVWPYFSTPRDVKRFLSAFEFYFEGHTTDGVLEVNPVDLI